MLGLAGDGHARLPRVLAVLLDPPGPSGPDRVGPRALAQVDVEEGSHDEDFLPVGLDLRRAGEPALGDPPGEPALDLFLAHVHLRLLGARSAAPQCNYFITLLQISGPPDLRRACTQVPLRTKALGLHRKWGDPVGWPPADLSVRGDPGAAIAAQAAIEG